MKMAHFYFCWQKKADKDFQASSEAFLALFATETVGTVEAVKSTLEAGYWRRQIYRGLLAAFQSGIRPIAVEHCTNADD